MVPADCPHVRSRREDGPAALAVRIVQRQILAGGGGREVFEGVECPQRLHWHWRQIEEDLHVAKRVQETSIGPTEGDVPHPDRAAQSVDIDLELDRDPGSCWYRPEPDSCRRRFVQPRSQDQDVVGGLAYEESVEVRGRGQARQDQQHEADD